MLCTWFTYGSKTDDPKDKEKIIGSMFQMRQLRFRSGSDLPKITQYFIS